MKAEYDGFASFYDLEYGHKNDDIEFYLHVAREIGGPILEIGAGTGRLTLPLAQEGHSIWGIDNSGKMLEKAEEKKQTLPGHVIPEIHFEQQDMREFSLDQTFNLCIIPFRAFLHNLNIDDQLKTLDRIYEHMEPNGILAFDLFVPLYSMLAKTQWQDSFAPEELADPKAGVSISTQVDHDPVEQLLTINNTYRVNDKVEEQVMKYRYIFRYEMELLLNMAGFTVEQVYGGFEGQEYDFNSGLMIVTASKQDES